MTDKNGIHPWNNFPLFNQNPFSKKTFYFFYNFKKVLTKKERKQIIYKKKPGQNSFFQNVVLFISLIFVGKKMSKTHFFPSNRKKKQLAKHFCDDHNIFISIESFLVCLYLGCVETKQGKGDSSFFCHGKDGL